MDDRIIMSSNSVDSHGDVMTIEALKGSVIQINGTRKLPYTINHRRELPPIGRMIDARLEEKDNLVLLTAIPVKYQTRKTIDWENNYLIQESFEEPAPFISRYNKNIKNISISLDPSNFISSTAFESFNRSIYQSDNDITLEIYGRKSEIPPPEIIFGVAKIYALYKLLEPFTKKLAERFADDVYDELKKQLKIFRDFVVRITKAARQETIPKNKTLTVIFEIHSEPFIELIVKSDDANILSKGLSEKRLVALQAQLAKFCTHFSVDKIQFRLSEKGNWKFNFLITDNGEVIGDKAAFKERDKQFDRYKLQNSEVLKPRSLKKRS